MINTIYPNKPLSPVSFVREPFTDVGAAPFKLGIAAQCFLAGSDFVIWDAATGGNQLAQGTDYEFMYKHIPYSDRSGLDIWLYIKMNTIAYQSGGIWIDCKIVGTETDPDFFNSLVATDESLQTQINAISGGLPTREIYDMHLSNNSTDATNDIDIAAGFCYSDGFTNVINLTTGLTKRLDETFAEGDNQGMLQSGQTKQNSMTYHIYAMVKADGTTDIQATAYNVAFALPSGFIASRRRGLIKTKSDGVIRAFNHRWQDKTYMYVTKTVVSDWQVPTTATLTALDVPLGVEVEPIALFSTGVASAGGGLVFNIYQTNLTPPALSWLSSGKSGFNGTVSNWDQSEGGAKSVPIRYKTNASGQIYFHRHSSGVYYSTGYNSSLQIEGFIDFTV